MSIYWFWILLHCGCISVQFSVQVMSFLCFSQEARLQELDEEHSLLQSGLQVIEKARKWYFKRITAIQEEKLHLQNENQYSLEQVSKITQKDRNQSLTKESPPCWFFIVIFTLCVAGRDQFAAVSAESPAQALAISIGKGLAACSESLTLTLKLGITEMRTWAIMPRMVEAMSRTWKPCNLGTITLTSYQQKKLDIILLQKHELWLIPFSISLPKGVLITNIASFFCSQGFIFNLVPVWVTASQNKEKRTWLGWRFLQGAQAPHTKHQWKPGKNHRGEITNKGILQCTQRRVLDLQLIFSLILGSEKMSYWGGRWIIGSYNIFVWCYYF